MDAAELLDGFVQAALSDVETWPMPPDMKAGTITHGSTFVEVPFAHGDISVVRWFDVVDRIVSDRIEWIATPPPFIATLAESYAIPLGERHVETYWKAFHSRRFVSTYGAGGTRQELSRASLATIGEAVRSSGTVVRVLLGGPGGLVPGSS